ELGRLAGTEEAIDWGFQANANPPRLRTHDRFGERIDEVEFHPARHELMKVAVGHGLHALPWREPRPGAHAARAAAFYIWSQVEGGHGCPVSMTYAAVPALRKSPALAAEWEPLMTTLDYDPGLRHHSNKKGVLFGMAMTERQGGSDVRANTTRAVSAGANGEHLLTGHKWFCSAPMCDAFLVLAQAAGGRAGDASHGAPQRVRQNAQRAAADGECPRGPRGRVRSDDDPDDAAGRRVRPCGRSGGGAFSAHRRRHREVLDVQARDRARGRGPRVPWRQWLR